MTRLRRALSLAAVTALVASGCSGEDGDGSAASPTGGSAGPSTSAEPAEPSASEGAEESGADGIPSWEPTGEVTTNGPFAVEEVDRFDEPWAMAFLPDTGDLLVSERSGVLHLRDQQTGDRIEVDGVPEVVDAGQGGLGDVVPGPTFVDDQVVYLSWAEEGDGGVGAAVGRARLQRGDGSASLEDLEVVWRQTPKVSGDGHFGHRIAFSPNGRRLFVSSGERQLMDPAQDTSNTLGSIVRLTLDGDPAPGNPFADRGGPSAEIYSYGHRNPLGLEFAPDGHLWSSEMGPEGGDELNLIEPGNNYGWPEVSNGDHYDGAGIPDHAPGDGYDAPVASWNPSISPGSLLLYRGDLFADWNGDAFLGGLSGETLIRVDLDGTEAGEVTAWEMPARIRAVEEAPDGAIWLLEDEGAGRLVRLTPA
ncbi:PQQ-dependent sugar dehydrogenase [Nocardioides sambongensis]|uniref:PQQ-dependent sugar dehydrogenase n=1 Tax=Nocardioides sambongensis TaxID=2589074 RepID=UPI00112B4084|nr:PQQ-dependent sugar dehydrogenase [Nocardioides sambongensis]